MIQQDVNLFQYLPKKAKVVFNIKMLSLVYLIFFIFLMLLHVFDIHKKNKSIAELNNLTIKMQTQEQRFKELTAQYAWINPQDLDASMNKLKHDLEFNENRLNELFNQIRFSDYMLGISQAVLPGAWLTSFALTKQGKEIELKGRALNAELANRFLIQLQNQSVFRNANLSLEEVSNTKAQDSNSRYLIFNISTQVTKIQ